MLALGRAKTLTCFTLASGASMTLSMLWLAGRYGLQGLAWSRMLYGPITCLVYIPLLVMLVGRSKGRTYSAISTALYKEAQ